MVVRYYNAKKVKKQQLMLPQQDKKKNKNFQQKKLVRLTHKLSLTNAWQTMATEY